jgi:UDP-N-acetylmuramoylalanine--D-glutamate ligase
LPHRLQLVGEFAGRRFYNDSISTTPESTIAALDSFGEPVVILAGGYDKQIDLTGLSRKIAERAKAVSLLGQTALALKSGITTRNALVPIATFRDFKNAFDWAVEQSDPGDVILLSPGCASYDWFTSFVDRGEQFCRLVSEVRF